MAPLLESSTPWPPTPEEAMRLALSLAKQPTHASARKQLRAIGSQASPQGIGPQDAGHRVLAAVQIWGVFHYFFPYKDLMGEDWDAVLREFIPRMEAADEGSQYFWAIAEMVSHVHDSHLTTSPLFHAILNGAPPPAYARWIEGSPVIAGFYDDSARQSGIAVGDAVLKVDGEDAMFEQLKDTKAIIFDMRGYPMKPQFLSHRA